jgi:hypothetical protein
MLALRRICLLAALLGSVLGGSVFSAAPATAHATAPQQLASECGGVPVPC